MTFIISIASVLYITILLLAESLFLWQSPRRTNFYIRLVGSFFVFYAFVFGYGVVSEWMNQLFQNDSLATTLMSLIFFFVVFFLTIPLILFCWKINLRTALFYAAAGYSVEHIANSVVQILRQVCVSLVGPLDVIVDRFVFALALKAIFVLVFYFFVILPFKKRNRMNINDNRILWVSIVNIFICIILNIFRSYGFGNAINPYTSNVICSIYAIFGCILCLMMQMGIFRESSLLEDNLALEQLLKDEAKKHEISKSTVDLINIKVHDLKYQIHQIENNGGEATKEMISGIYDTFAIYDSIVKTGNEVFDILIMNIWPLIQKNGIQFTYMVDGEALSTLKSVDISALFGNLIDNAIESVMKESEEKRVVSLNVHQERQFLFIHLHNVCEKSPEFENGLPITTKGDTRYHGFGVRSVRYLVEKYNGVVKMSWENGIYSVDIII